MESLAACRPRAAEIIVVDQSRGEGVAQLTAAFQAVGVIRIVSAGRGIGIAMNEGIQLAQHEVVFGTHDDCSVAKDWISVGCALASIAPECIFTGRVLWLGNRDAVPSTKDDPQPRDFTGENRCDVLFPANMVLPRSKLIEVGGFDERFITAAEDNDLCYRWLRSGRCLRYEPQLRVWHREWRNEEELRQLYVRYWREQGRFYAKHLRQGDRNIFRFLLVDFLYMLGAFRSIGSRTVKGRRPLVDSEQRGLFRGLVPGLVNGWRALAPPQVTSPRGTARRAEEEFL